MNKRLIVLILVVLISAGCQNSAVIDKSLNSNINEEKPGLTAVATSTPEITPTAESTSSDEIQPKVEPPPVLDAELSIPPTLDYSVPFTPQAPYAVWDRLHEEACEEAAMIIVTKYFQGQPLDAHSAEQEILNLVKWEENHDYQVDLTAQEASDILITYFDLKSEVVTQVTVDRIKEELAAGKLIIVPAAGRELGNPYFQRPGPIYHMLVIRGYTNDEFITNDPGTKRGEGFKYKFQTLLNAVHDWDHQLAQDGMTDEEMAQGQKVMIVVSH